jgi:hypothetical protein
MDLDLAKVLRRQRQTHEPIHSNGYPALSEAAGDGAGIVASLVLLSYVDKYHKTAHTQQRHESSPANMPVAASGRQFVVPDMPAERSVTTFSERHDNPLSWDVGGDCPRLVALAIRLSLTASIEQATMHEEGAARRSSGRRDHLLLHSINFDPPSCQGTRSTP